MAQMGSSIRLARRPC